jgi:hypothetical protein
VINYPPRIALLPVQFRLSDLRFEIIQFHDSPVRIS